MFRNKEYVLTIYNEGSFTKAAEKLYVSQPSLSATIKRLEEKINAQIFDRSTSPVTLTETGKEYVKYALEIEQKERDFERYVSDYMNLLTGKIRIGGSSMFSSFVLPKTIAEYKSAHPKIQFEIYEDSSKNLINKLSLGDLDIVIDNTVINNEDICSSLFTSEFLLLAVPKSFTVNEQLAKIRMSADDVKAEKHKNLAMSAELEYFKDQPFILLNPDNDTGKRANKLFKKHQLEPKISFTLDQQVTAYNISSSGLGVCFVSDTLIKNIDASPDLWFYRLSDRETARKIYLYRKNNRYLSLACKKFIEYNTEK